MRVQSAFSDQDKETFDETNKSLLCFRWSRCLPENWCTIISRATATICTVTTRSRSRTRPSQSLCRELCSIFRSDSTWEGGLGRFIGDRGYQRLCVEEAKSVFSLSHVSFSWFSVTAVTVRSFFSLYKYVRLRRMRFEGRGTWWVAGDWGRK